MSKGNGLLTIAAVLFLGLIDSPPVVAEGYSVRKTDGDFSTTSATFVPVPGTSIAFNSSVSGLAVLSVSATELPDGIPNSQIGVRIDGVDYPLESNDIHTFAGGVAVFRIGLGGVTFVNPLSEGVHTAEVTVRRIDETGGFISRVAASPELPLNFVIQLDSVVGSPAGAGTIPIGGKGPFKRVDQNRSEF